MNTLALALNTAVKSAVTAIDPLYNVHYVDYDSQFETHRFCDSEEPSPNNPNTWFFNWQTSEDPTTEAAFQSLTAYKSSVAGQTAGLFQTDDDFINALGDALGDGADALSTLSDSVRIFHPTSLGHQKIRDVMESALEEAGVPEPESVNASSISSSTATSATTTTSPPPPPSPTTKTSTAPSQSCTLQPITGGKAGIIGHDCACNIGPTPSPLTTNGAVTCPTTAAKKRNFVA